MSILSKPSFFSNRPFCEENDGGERPGSSLTYRYSLRLVNCALRLDPPDEMVVVVGEPDRAVVEVNRVAAAAVPLRDDAIRARVDLRQWNAN